MGPWQETAQQSLMVAGVVIGLIVLSVIGWVIQSPTMMMLPMVAGVFIGVMAFRSLTDVLEDIGR